MCIVHRGPLDTLYRCELLSKLQVRCHPQVTPGQLSQVGSWCVTADGWYSITSKAPVLCLEPSTQQRRVCLWDPRNQMQKIIPTSRSYHHVTDQEWPGKTASPSGPLHPELCKYCYSLVPRNMSRNMQMEASQTVQ